MTVAVFKSRLKTFLFSQAFSSSFRYVCVFVVSDAPDDDYDVAYNDDDHDAIYEDLCSLRRRVSLQVQQHPASCPLSRTI